MIEIKEVQDIETKEVEKPGEGFIQRLFARAWLIASLYAIIFGMIGVGAGKDMRYFAPLLIGTGMFLLTAYANTER